MLTVLWINLGVAIDVPTDQHLMLNFNILVGESVVVRNIGMLEIPAGFNLYGINKLGQFHHLCSSSLQRPKNSGLGVIYLFSSEIWP